MKIVKNNDQLKKELAGRITGFVPTMGALHDGHLSLVSESKRRGLFTVASIFVNPTQFNNQGDLDSYPIDTEGDITLLEEANCDLLFLPSASEIYPSDKDLSMYDHEIGTLDTIYEGSHRPGHFKGVAQVVHRLFDLVEPAVAFFGEKDFQQLAVIRQLVEHLNLSIEVVGMPTIRESDGLAMSSRNRRLNQAMRKRALSIYHVLNHCREEWKNERLQDLLEEAENRLIDAGLEPEYVAFIDPMTFKACGKAGQSPAQALIAAWCDDVRLIDNMRLA